MQSKSLAEILAVMQHTDPSGVALVSHAYEFSKNAHEGQKRYSGDPYFTHAAEVGFYLAEAGLDPRAIAAGLLHDTIEDAKVTPETIAAEFGEEVRMLVEAVTKLGTLRYHGMERHTESLRKLFAATAKDIRVLIIKLMDRLHNSRTFEHLPNPEKRARIAMETLEIYAPIADRLGMSVLKQHLEDNSFPYAYPKEFKKVQEILKERNAKEDEDRLEKAEKTLKRELADAGIRAFRTEARVKGMYSLFRKLQRKDWDISKIFDIVALRVIFPSDIGDCYTALGVIHAHWRPVPGKIKDYIACPKPNGYRSIHTTIYTGDGGALEIQLRTEDMHREALYGIASHFSYKAVSTKDASGKKLGIEWVRQFFPKMLRKSPENQPGADTNAPAWVRELAHAHIEDEDPEEYLDTLKSDFFNHRVFVFTPKGDVIDLPVSATPLDLAYAIHSDIGNKTTGSRVNGRMVALDTPLHNGDIVEIITKASAKPSRKWLELVKTSAAKKHIRTELASQEKNR